MVKKIYFKVFASSTLCLLLLLLSYSNYSIVNLSYGAYIKAPLAPSGPTLKDDKLSVEKVTDGLDIPTSMAFLGPNDLLVTEKETGKVIHIINGQIQDEPALDVAVANSIERGLLGIAMAKQADGKTYVFISYTESGNDEDSSDVEDNVEPEGNRLYRYEYVDGQLINPVLIIDLTAAPENDRGEHNGGKIRIGPDNNVYYIVGEVGGHRTQAQNIEDGPEPNGLGGVLRITQDGQIVPGDAIFGDESPLDLYYAMGIRNSFGMDFDSVTGNLWDTENGPDTGDEINLVYPGFNSGWSLIQGLSQNDLLENDVTPDDLVYFGQGSYAEPKLSWVTPIGITALKFLDSDKLGTQYQNNMFVGDINNGLLYRFVLNEARDDISFDSGYTGNTALLADKEVNDPKENQPFIFGQGFGGITDIEVGPDGFLYVLSYTGSLFRIAPSTEASTTATTASSTSPDDSATITENNQATEQSESEDDQNVAQDGNSIPAVILGLYADKSYSPNPITIERGQTITWYNGDTISHSVTSGLDNDDNAGEAFDSKAIIPNQSYGLRFDDTGDYPYYCFYHPSMVGVVIVE
ncbi:PQQ-dependent sugar dehydrogenase [Candidatus Nitrosocosmicus hydrocola]|uniref:PQQ-dependent sugar dehydrogenase n=1 Tax=Candidatus Nitrosocosmicus hydrocola TaxID=1826872 RepID=UPI0011E5A9F1|nr:PQQ-dependent sugar dehydrogenase [Candidatus Nitrosocosmicus hydrocola]